MTNDWQLYSVEDKEAADEANKQLDRAMAKAIEKKNPLHITILMHTPSMMRLGSTDSEPRNEFYDRWEAAFGEGFMGIAEEAWSDS
jgi:hypothetical protein